MGVAAFGQVRSDAVSFTACSLLISADNSHWGAYTGASPVRDEEAAGSNPATRPSSQAMTDQPMSWPFSIE